MTALSERESAAQKSLQTFCTYIKAWRHLLPEQNRLEREQESLESFKTLQGGAPADKVRGSYLRGALTLRLMNQLPLDSHPDLAESANYWAPVQAYYVIHGYGLATLNALAAGNPRDHKHFRSLCSAQVLERFFPFPFNMMCLMDPLDRETCTVENCPSGINEIVEINNLSTPTSSNAAALAGKALFTTRRHFLDELFDKHRAEGKRGKRKRKNLKPADKRRLAENLHGTSFIDFLYRMRVRSNYDDPEMFIFGQLGRTAAVDHYNNLFALVHSFASLCEKVISRKLGRKTFEGIVAPLHDSDNGKIRI